MKVFKNIITSISLLVVLYLIGYNLLYKNRWPQTADLSAEHVRLLREQYDSIANEYQGMTYHNGNFTREEDNVKIKLTDEDNKLEMKILIQDENIMIVYPANVEDEKLKIGIEYAHAEDIGWHKENQNYFAGGLLLTFFVLTAFCTLFLYINEKD